MDRDELIAAIEMDCDCVGSTMVEMLQAIDAFEADALERGRREAVEVCRKLRDTTSSVTTEAKSVLSLCIAAIEALEKSGGSDG